MLTIRLLLIFGFLLECILPITMGRAGSRASDELDSDPPTASQIHSEATALDIDREILIRMERVADGYKQRGLYAYAEAIVQDVFEIRQKKKGAGDPEMAYYHNNLGWLKAEQGKDSEAERHYLRALAITEKTWGPDHPELTDRLNNLAGVYRLQARFSEAEALYLRALRIWQNYAGPDHGDLAVVLNTLGGDKTLGAEQRDVGATATNQEFTEKPASATLAGTTWPPCSLSP